MKISATVKSKVDKYETFVQTNDIGKELAIPQKSAGQGSSVNGGELLLLSLATCFCNDIYREAAKRNISIASVEVYVTENLEPKVKLGETSNTEQKFLLMHPQKK